MGTGAHRLVAIGDSMTQGFMGGAIHRTDRAYPVMLARALGVEADFRVPDFDGQGGLPINLERLIRALSAKYGDRVRWWQTPGMIWFARHQLDAVEDYWERGEGAGPQARTDPHHNLAVWGFEVDDAKTLTDPVSRSAISQPRDDWVGQIPGDPMYRTARRTLNPALDDTQALGTQLTVAAGLADDRGIENLLVYLGANNCLGTVTALEINYVPSADLDKPRPMRRGNLYRVEDFATHFLRLADGVTKVGAGRVFVATIPHVTIPPVTRGVTLGAAGRGAGPTLRHAARTGRNYFAYYTRPWIWDGDFDPDRHPHLTRADAIEIDAAIDGYNQIIRDTAEARGWHVVPICKTLDDLAYRSHSGHPPYRLPSAALDALEANPHTAYLVHAHGDERRTSLDTRYFHIVPTPRGYERPYLVTEGGLFSLDGIHPTTIGYGVIAHEFCEVMRRAGVPDLAPLDWAHWIGQDTLVTEPPPMLRHLRHTLRTMDRRGWLSDLLRLF